MEWLAAVPTTGVTAVTIIVAVLIALSKQWIYMRPHVAEIRADAAAQIKAAREDTARQIVEVRRDSEERVEQARADRDARIDEIREDRDARIADKNAELRNIWAAYNAAEASRRVMAEQTEQMLQGLETTIAVVQAIPTGGSSHG